MHFSLSHILAATLALSAAPLSYADDLDAAAQNSCYPPRNYRQCVSPFQMEFGRQNMCGGRNWQDVKSFNFGFIGMVQASQGRCSWWSQDQCYRAWDYVTNECNNHQHRDGGRYTWNYKNQPCYVDVTICGPAPPQPRPN
ncbi:uncharacterized protein K452DRAFT_307094 [Aplosporella prunicola CBS 121167]|uniref:Uncharacterized protein n=1 Tax=Aplosporella prunicola CBS 121167 TaxID=1176127 RepID=A0A6A6BK59_9PEZI|nr:uncharacterized protein K452DRAFT_307094 [Aplosporella prunicola CBS 121167]KAF2143715.1 hypothetical protein K452DRAFT_307094 [Aplosporella prunicola CBS 121167]